jgi:GNAT superfamily N-acetyltransferase
MDRPPAPRRATPDDAAAVTELVAAAYRHYVPLLGRTPLPMLADHAAAIRDHEVWVIDDEAGRPLAVIDCIPRPDHLWIDNVAVDPAAQGRGLGRALLRLAEDEAARVGEVRLLTNERYTSNIAMYERYGYVETHREPYLGTDLVHFRKVLRTPQDAG